MVFLLLILNRFMDSFDISIADFEQVNVSRETNKILTSRAYYAVW